MSVYNKLRETLISWENSLVEYCLLSLGKIQKELNPYDDDDGNVPPSGRTGDVYAV